MYVVLYSLLDPMFPLVSITQTLRVRSQSLVLITSLITRFQWTGFWTIAFQRPMTQHRTFGSTAAMLSPHCALSGYCFTWSLTLGFPDFLTECKLTCLQSSHNQKLIFVLLMKESLFLKNTVMVGMFICMSVSSCCMVASASQSRLYGLHSFWCPRIYIFIQIQHGCHDRDKA